MTVREYSDLRVSSDFWHELKYEKPPVAGAKYLVTEKIGDHYYIDLNWFEKEMAEVGDGWEGRGFYSEDKDGLQYNHYVTAWAFMPEPYKGIKW